MERVSWWEPLSCASLDIQPILGALIITNTSLEFLYYNYCVKHPKNPILIMKAPKP